MFKKVACKALCLVAVPLIMTGCLKGVDPVIKKSHGVNTSLPGGLIPPLDSNETYHQIVRHTFSEVGADFDPFVTAQGEKILYASTRISIKSDIFIKASNSKVNEQITHTPHANEKQPQLSPDGTRIIYASDKEGKWGIYEVSAKNRSSVELEVISNGRVNEQPCYSPNGKEIAYVTWLPRKSNWYIATLNRKTQQEKIYGPGLFPRYSPDGSKLLFQRPRSRSPQWFSIWILDLKREAVSEIVSNNNWAAVTPNWSPDGKKIIFAAINKSVQAHGEFAGDDIYTIWADGTHLIRLTNDQAEDWSPIWVKSGRIYFVSKRNGYQNIWSIFPRDMDPYHPDTIESYVDDVTNLDNL